MAEQIQKVSLELLQKLPKVDLHCHLDGSLRLSTILELAKENNVKLPTFDEEGIRKIVVKEADCTSLVDYLKAFDITLMVMQEKDALIRTAYELAEDAAKENIRYLEVRYAPILHLERNLKLTEVVESVIDGLQMAEKKFQIKTGVIICGIRHISPDYSLRLAELALAYKNKGVVGFDLAGAEADYPAKHHREAFDLVLKNNVNCTVHAGEAYGPESISQAIHYCGAHRIGHGTRLKENGDLLNYVNDHRMPLEICLTSNIQTSSVKNFAEHPLRFYYDYGLRVTVNTDNRLVSNTTVSRELWLAHQHFKFNLYELIRLIKAGIKSAFLPYKDKQKLFRSMTDEINRILGENVTEI
ncbi:MAG: adenosine deaminase [Candidatus Wallbacteria bacterium]|nr:adenosine deaminase [Candidatus Wallbacteria bacterium]